MGRRHSSPVERLAAEARSIEALLTELSPPAEMVEKYWQLSLELIDIVIRIEALVADPDAAGGDEAYARLRTDLTRIESRITELEREIGNP